MVAAHNAALNGITLTYTLKTTRNHNTNRYRRLAASERPPELSVTLAETMLACAFFSSVGTWWFNFGEEQSTQVDFEGIVQGHGRESNSVWNRKPAVCVAPFS